MAQAGYYGIASRLLSLRSLFWHRVKHEQLQKSSDGLLLLSGGMNVEISVRKRKLPAMLSVLATCLWERVGRWPPFLPWRMRLSFFFFFLLSAKPLLRQNCHTILLHMIIDLAPSSGLTFVPLHGGNFEDFFQKLHPEISSAPFARE